MTIAEAGTDRSGRCAHRGRWGAAALLLALGLGGCVSGPDGVLAPVAPVAGAGRVDMLAVTTRNPAADPGALFTGARAEQVSAVRMLISIPPDRARKIGEVEWPKALPPDPASAFAALQVQPLDAQGLRAWFATRPDAEGRVLVFVHGFNTDFETAVFRLAQIAHDSCAAVAPVLFSWPSRGSLFAYEYDKDSATLSRNALEQMLDLTAASPDVRDITILAHSMGAWLTMEALRQSAIRNGRLWPKLHNVILASADMDIDVFRKDFADLGAAPPQFTLFVSRDDRALRLSSLIAGDTQRLGAVDPSVEPNRSRLEAVGIAVYDLTALRAADTLAHSKFADSPEMVRLLGSRLIGGQKLSDARNGLGEQLGAVAAGAARTAGSAAGVLLSAPSAIIDPGARSSGQERIGEFGRNLGGVVRVLQPSGAAAATLPACPTAPRN